MVIAEAGSGRWCRWVTAAAALALCAAATGCGGGAGDAAVSAPEDCVLSWNAENESLTFGRHVYVSHQSKQAQVLLLEPSPGAVNVTGGQTCAVVFATTPGDPEFGTLGLVVTRYGWASMRELARGDSARLTEIQNEANLAPNATLFPDGTLDPN